MNINGNYNEVVQKRKKANEIGLNEHIRLVQDYCDFVSYEIKKRSLEHDLSKLSDEEFPLFKESISSLKDTTYGSEEYKKSLKKLEPALLHHYSNNRHHPEFFDNKISDMNLIDVVEMFCDWLAAIKKHNDGDIYKSLEINQKRFGYSDDLKSIFKNTADMFKNDMKN